MCMRFSRRFPRCLGSNEQKDKASDLYSPSEQQFRFQFRESRLSKVSILEKHQPRAALPVGRAVAHRTGPHKVRHELPVRDLFRQIPAPNTAGGHALPEAHLGGHADTSAAGWRRGRRRVLLHLPQRLHHTLDITKLDEGERVARRLPLYIHILPIKQSKNQKIFSKKGKKIK